jgi:hypothetical protein
MVTPIGISILIGAALGLRFNFLILIPTVVLVLAIAAAVGIAHPDNIWSAVLTVVLVVTGLQIGYLAGIMTRDKGWLAFAWLGRIMGGALNFGYSAYQRRFSMFKTLDIQKDMEVVGSDGKHVGIIDHLEAADSIMLSKDDPKAGGKPHLISVDWVDYVDSKIHLNKPSKRVVSEWQVAA